VPSWGARRDALLVALLRVVLSLACLASGFRAVSDDDYARIVIAAELAARPSLDPSGTSWLPLPFWLYGAPMWLFGDSLTTARGVALVLGSLSALLVWLSARWLGMPPRTALFGALAATLLPYGTWLSAATVPEAPCAALVLLGAVSLARPEWKLRAAGGLALGAACFCRYEAWGPAGVLALVSVVDALRTRQPRWLLAVGFAMTPIVLWLLHGVVRHGDALFFVERVTQYRAALGRGASGWGSAWLSTLLAIPRFEPELFAVFGVALVLSLSRGESPFSGVAWRPVAVLAALLLLLIAADARGGSATHHPERSLLPVFWFLALVTAGLVSNLALTLARAWLLPALALPLALAGSIWVRPNVSETFARRDEEEHIGRLLRGIGATDVALDTDDFGYFAVQAALGHGKSWPLSDHDPRNAAPPRPVTPEQLQRRLGDARWLVTTRERETLASPLGAVRATTPGFVVVALGAP
jgi:Dolichyl-phosphate-mannose-protein mannosyltransferase